MFKPLVFILLMLFTIINTKTTFSQSPIKLKQGSFKIKTGNLESFYYGLKEGDELQIQLAIQKGKALKYFEVVDMNGNVLYSEFKKSKINTSIPINETGIYKITVENSMGGKICELNLTRNPVDEHEFNSVVKWKVIADTLFKTKTEKYLVSSDTTFKNIIDQKAKVHSTMNLNGNKISTNIVFPPNTVSWSYYIGVNQEGTKAYKSALMQIEKNSASISTLFPGYGPLAALILGNASYLSKISGEDEIDFFVVLNDNVNLFLGGLAFNYVKKGKVVNDFSVMRPANGSNVHFCFSNDNAITPVFVDIKVTAMCVANTYGKREVNIPTIIETKVPYLD